MPLCLQLLLHSLPAKTSPLFPTLRHMSICPSCCTMNSGSPSAPLDTLHCGALPLGQRRAAKARGARERVETLAAVETRVIGVWELPQGLHVACRSLVRSALLLTMSGLAWTDSVTKLGCFYSIKPIRSHVGSVSAFLSLNF